MLLGSAFTIANARSVRRSDFILRRWAMAIFRLVQAGIAAMCWQFCIVILALLSATVHWRINHDTSNSAALLPFLTWLYVLSAVGASLTRTRFVDVTSMQIERASRAMNPVRPDHAARILLVQLAIPAIGCLIVALRPPPGMLIDLCEHMFGVPLLASMIWPGALSVLTAGFGERPGGGKSRPKLAFVVSAARLRVCTSNCGVARGLERRGLCGPTQTRTPARNRPMYWTAWVCYTGSIRHKKTVNILIPNSRGQASRACTCIRRGRLSGAGCCCWACDASARCADTGLSTTILAALVLAAVDLQVLLTGDSLTGSLPIGLPTIGLRLRLKLLSAFFGVVINGGVLAAAVYGLGLDRNKELTQRVEPLLPIFVAAMGLVPLADDAYSFLFYGSRCRWLRGRWWFLSSPIRKTSAPDLYLVMATFGTPPPCCFAFGVLAGLRRPISSPRCAGCAAPRSRGAVLAAALIGAGSKAGLAPLHVWLPLAHPAAPSHVSGLMSGVMTKVAVYAFVRIAFDLVGAPDWRWSVPVLVVGGAQRRDRRLACADGDRPQARARLFDDREPRLDIPWSRPRARFQGRRLVPRAALAMTAALLHALNHSCSRTCCSSAPALPLRRRPRATSADWAGFRTRCRRPRVRAYRRRRDLRAAAAQRLRLGMAAVAAVLLGPHFRNGRCSLPAPTVGAVMALTAALAAACFVRSSASPS